MKHWISDTVFYHIYPMGFCGAPSSNDFSSEPQERLLYIADWIPHLKEMGISAVYLGPLFESGSHGYDTVDYFTVDRRLGHNSTLAAIVEEFHRNDIKVILDGVFNHVGRNFFGFRDLQENREHSFYRDWFHNVRFNDNNQYNDHFCYEGWSGHYSLVKLNLKNPHVCNYLFEAVKMWITELKIDGLRLDAADCLDFDFMKNLVKFTRSLKSDFWITGEIIHGDYRRWANGETLDSVTNYELWKGLWSSHNDKNYFEVAYSLDREFGSNGLYKNLPLYNFVDNHDVNRIASQLSDPKYLYPIHCLLFTIPGIPSIYYGSEFGIDGKKVNNSDTPLRPFLNLDALMQNPPHPDLLQNITKLSNIRSSLTALRHGNYRQLYLQLQQFAFLREADSSQVIVAVNSDFEEKTIKFDFQLPQGTVLIDRLNNDQVIKPENGKIEIPLYPCWGRILEVVRN